jgi:hypothetical protein
MSLGITSLRPAWAGRAKAPEEAVDRASPAEPNGSFAERVAAILEEELQAGTLDLIRAGAGRLAPAPRSVEDLVNSASRIDWSGVLRALLDLVPSVNVADATSGVSADRGVDALPVLRAKRDARPGGTAEILTAVHCDGQGIEADLVWSDLVAGTGQRIPASRLSVRPSRVRLAGSGAVDVVVRVEVPSETAPGLYQGVLRASSPIDLGAVLTICVECRR